MAIPVDFYAKIKVERMRQRAEAYVLLREILNRVLNEETVSEPEFEAKMKLDMFWRVVKVLKFSNLPIYIQPRKKVMRGGFPYPEDFTIRLFTPKEERRYKTAYDRAQSYCQRPLDNCKGRPL